MKGIKTELCAISWRACARTRMFCGKFPISMRICGEGASTSYRQARAASMLRRIKYLSLNRAISCIKSNIRYLKNNLPCSITPLKLFPMPKTSKINSIKKWNFPKLILKNKAKKISFYLNMSKKLHKSATIIEKTHNNC